MTSQRYSLSSKLRTLDIGESMAIPAKDKSQVITLMKNIHRLTVSKAALETRHFQCQKMIGVTVNYEATPLVMITRDK